MKRNPKDWTRKKLAQLDYFYSVEDISIKALAIVYGKSENAIRIQLDRLDHMHSNTGTSFNEWGRIARND